MKIVEGFLLLLILYVTIQWLSIPFTLNNIEKYLKQLVDK